MYKINSEKILFTQLGEEGVILDIEKNEYLTLNETYFKILKGVEQGKTTVEINNSLMSEYDISDINCRKEVNRVISELLEKGFIIE